MLEATERSTVCDSLHMVPTTTAAHVRSFLASYGRSSAGSFIFYFTPQTLRMLRRPLWVLALGVSSCCEASCLLFFSFEFSSSRVALGLTEQRQYLVPIIRWLLVVMVMTEAALAVVVVLAGLDWTYPDSHRRKLEQRTHADRLRECAVAVSLLVTVFRPLTASKGPSERGIIDDDHDNHSNNNNINAL